jgi:hypothetical protein
MNVEVTLAGKRDREDGDVSPHTTSPSGSSSPPPGKEAKGNGGKSKRAKPNNRKLATTAVGEQINNVEGRLA